MDKRTVEKLADLLATLTTLDDVKEADRMLRAAWNRLRRQAVSQWQVGQRVRFKVKSGDEVTGIITQVNRTTVSVKQEGKFPFRWNIDPSLLKAA